MNVKTNTTYSVQTKNGNNRRTTSDRSPTSLGKAIKKVFGRKVLKFLCDFENIIKPYAR